MSSLTNTQSGVIFGKHLALCYFSVLTSTYEFYVTKFQFFRTQPQNTACQAMKDKRCCWTRGKVIGGSSVLNTMLYIRGNKRDFDQWESLGNPGWGYEDVLPYFRKSEDQRNPYLAQNKRQHGTGTLFFKIFSNQNKEQNLLLYRWIHDRSRFTI